MKNEKWITYFFIAIFLVSCNSNGVKRIEIKYVNFNVQTIAHINCSEFDEKFKPTKKYISISNPSQIKNFITEFENLQEVEFQKDLEPDTRLKLTLFYNDEKMEVCMDQFTILKDGKIYKFTDSFKSILNEMVKENLWE